MAGRSFLLGSIGGKIISVEPLDDLDREMIELLCADGRMSVPALATRLGIGRATAYNRFERLTTTGVIERFTAVVSPRALGLGVAALVLVDVDQQRWREARSELGSLAGVVWIGLATGPFDMAILIRTTDLDHLRDVVLVGLHQLPAVNSAQTFVLLDEPPVTQRRL